MKRTLPLLFLWLLNPSLTAQNFTGNLYSVTQYYENDSLTNFNAPEGHLRGMHYFTVDMRKGRWEAGAVFETYLPGPLLGYNPGLQGNLLTDYFVRYKENKLDITAGYFYQQFGNGLTLRTWRSRTLGIDNAIRGLRIKYYFPSGIKLIALTGNMRTGMKLSGSTVSGISLKVPLNTFWGQFTFNPNMVSRYQTTENNDKLRPSVEIYSFNTQFSSGKWEIALEYAYKTPEALYANGVLNDRVLFDGDALLFSAGFSTRGLGIAASFRRSENMQLYAQRELQGNFYNIGTVNYIPSLVKQHDFLLTTLYVYATKEGISFTDQSVGEIGGQLDIYYKIRKKTWLGGKYGIQLAFNYAQWHGLNTRFIPALGVYRRPYWEAGSLYYRDINLDIKKKINRKLKTSLHLIHQTYNQRKLEGHGETVNAFTVIYAWTWKLPHYSSLSFSAEHLATRQDKKNWAAASLEYNLAGKYGVYLTDMYNYGDTKIHYYNAGLVYTSKGNRISLGYGRTRGGLICVGGVCRYVPPNKGLQLSVSLQFN